MPSVSKPQEKTMAAIAHGWHPDNPELAKIPMGVAKDFNQADKAKHARLRQAMMKVTVKPGRSA